MPLEYTITYNAENIYENWVHDAYWQFLIIPQENANQHVEAISFENSLHIVGEMSINGYGFNTIRVHPNKKFKEILFQAQFKALKDEVNPFDFISEDAIAETFEKIKSLSFKVDFESFLRATAYTNLPPKNKDTFTFDPDTSIFDNLRALNDYTYHHLNFKTDVTDVTTVLEEIMRKRQGVCQDFTHLFCAWARLNGIPARYVSGYLHQGNGFFGDSAMHAWAEAYIPTVGWVGFDPTNNLLANTHHIKVAHGKDYTDCSPLKGVVYTTGRNTTSHTVKVSATQQQQQ